MFSRTHSIALPVMACRLILSLKKSACEPTGARYLSNDSRERSAAGALEFVPPTFITSCEVPDTLTQPSEDDVELGSCLDRLGRVEHPDSAKFRRFSPSLSRLLVSIRALLSYALRDGVDLPYAFVGIINHCTWKKMARLTSSELGTFSDQTQP